MNGLEITVLLILAASAFMGWRTGFLRVLYSLLAWTLALTFGTWATPHIASYLEQNTGIQAALQSQCADYLQKLAEQKADPAVSLFGTILGDAGIYDTIAAEAAGFLINGISFFLAIVLVGILMRLGLYALDGASHLPVIEETNKALGAAAGLFKGLIITWILFYLITLFGATETGSRLLSYIEESPFLSAIYNYNILLQLIMKFL